MDNCGFALASLTPIRHLQIMPSDTGKGRLPGCLWNIKYFIAKLLESEKINISGE
jgi:hypothetical protein